MDAGMEETLLLTSIATFTLLAVLCSAVFGKLKFPPLVGYLAAGIVIANAFDVNEAGETAISILSDLGLVLLMFSLGLEINLKKIKKQGTQALTVVIFQLPLSVIGGMAAGTAMGFGPVQSLILGAVISGCSTAAVTVVLLSQKKLEKSRIDTIILIMIMEDVGQVIMLSVLTPVMAGSSMDISDLILLVTTIASFMVISSYVGIKYLPRAINWVSDNVSEEVLMVISVGLAFGMAFVATLAGLSMAIGAFMMGLMVSGCRKSKEIGKSVEPIKNLFMAMFFISVGMEVHVSTLLSSIGTIAFLASKRSMPTRNCAFSFSVPLSLKMLMVSKWCLMPRL